MTDVTKNSRLFAVTSTTRSTLLLAVRFKTVFSRVCLVRYVPRHTAGITGTGHFGKLGMPSIPVPDTW